jgi:hypothetical protein
MLQPEEGCSIASLSATLGWLPHTVRAALTSLRRKGHRLAKGKDASGTTVYRIPTGSNDFVKCSAEAAKAA